MYTGDNFADDFAIQCVVFCSAKFWTVKCTLFEIVWACIVRWRFMQIASDALHEINAKHRFSRSC